MNSEKSVKNEIDARLDNDQWNQLIAERVLGEIRYQQIKKYSTVFAVILFLSMSTYLFMDNIRDSFFESEHISIINEYETFVSYYFDAMDE